MSVLRNLNVLDQMRLDVPHFRLLESAVRGDFDTVVGKIAGGSRGLVVRGMTIAGLAGDRAETLQLVVAESIVINFNASESGSFLSVPSDTPNEVLNGATNGNVTGSFVAGTVNYVGVDFVRAEDPATADLVTFQSPSGEITQELTNLAETLNYRIVIGTTPFSAQSNLVPVAKVLVDTSGFASQIVDARPMLFRLGSGGDAPSSTWSYPWPQGRIESSDFTGADKAITDQKAWNDAVMTRLWELGGGNNWFSDTADRNVWSINTESPFANGDYWTFNSGTGATEWKGIRFFFSGSGSGIYYNDVAGTTGSPVTLVDGQCVYVDLDRTSNASLNALVGEIATVGTGTIPGSRWVLAWRNGTQLYTRNWRYPIGTLFTPATNLAQGVVRLHAAAPVPTDPVVAMIGANNTLSVTATSGTSSTAATFVGSDTDGGAAVAGTGVRGVGGEDVAGGFDGGTGVRGEGGAAVDQGGYGVRGIGGSGGLLDGVGVWGSSGTAQGLLGTSTSSQGVLGSSTSGEGVRGTSVSGTGVSGSSTSGTGMSGTGAVAGVSGTGTTNGHGVSGTGAGTGDGVRGTATSAVGVRGIATTGTGVRGQSENVGVRGYGVNNGTGVVGTSEGNGYGGEFTTIGAGIAAVKATSTNGPAFESDDGGVTIPNNETYSFKTAKTGVIVIGASELSKISGSAVLTAMDGNLAVPYYPLAPGSTAQTVVQVRVPRGAIVTGIEALVRNSSGAETVSRPTLRLAKYTTAASALTTSDLCSGGTFTIPTGAGNPVWVSIGGSITSSAMVNGTTSDVDSGLLVLEWNPSAPAASTLRFGGWRITYTYTTVDFMV